jgi:hypothetical protein
MLIMGTLKKFVKSIMKCLLQIPLFKCQWVKQPHVIEVDEYGFAIVDCHTPVREGGIEACIRVHRMFKSHV